MININGRQITLTKKFTVYNIFATTENITDRTVQLHYKQDKNETEKFKVKFAVYPSELANKAKYSIYTSSSNLYSLNFDPDKDTEREFYPMTGAPGSGGTSSNKDYEKINCTFNNLKHGLTIREKSDILVLKPDKIAVIDNTDFSFTI